MLLLSLVLCSATLRTKTAVPPLDSLPAPLGEAFGTPSDLLDLKRFGDLLPALNDYTTTQPASEADLLDLLTQDLLTVEELMSLDLPEAALLAVLKEFQEQLDAVERSAKDLLNRHADLSVGDLLNMPKSHLEGLQEISDLTDLDFEWERYAQPLRQRRRAGIYTQGMEPNTEDKYLEKTWEDGRLCGVGLFLTCNFCINKATYWTGKAMTACGEEPQDWEDGTVCGLGSTCGNCINEASFWTTKVFTACGSQPDLLPDGTLCGVGTTCNDCENDYTYWASKAFTACGDESCWEEGTICGMGTTCKECCGGSDCPWYQVGVCTCN